MDKPTIELWEFSGVGVIIARPSGVAYSNQTGGTSCLHPEMEGVFAPLTDAFLDQQAKLYNFFTSRKWRGCCDRGIDEETADFVDAVLAESWQTQMLRVDRSRLADSHEAWVHVVVLEGRAAPDGCLLSGFTGARGVFTWENSD